jgi:hypothetical protein
MIAIQIILIAAFVLIMVRFLANPNSYQAKAWQKIAGVLLFFVALVAVLFPDTLNRIAHAVGVGRGSDLLLYLLTLSFIFVTLKLYVKSQYERQQLFKLARKIAILEASQNPHNKK